MLAKPKRHLDALYTKYNCAALFFDIFLDDVHLCLFVVLFVNCCLFAIENKIVNRKSELSDIIRKGRIY